MLNCAIAMATNSGSGSRLRLVTDVLRSFAAATTDHAQLLQTIVERVGELVDQPCSIRLLDDDGTMLETRALFHPRNDPRFRAHAERSIPMSPELAAMLDRRHAFHDVTVTQRGVDEAHPDSGARAPKSVIIAPLVAREQKLGFLFVVQPAGDTRDISEEDVDLVEGVARHAALAISNARLMSSLEAVERARAHERSILDTVSAPLLLLDRNARVMDANRAFQQAFGIAEAAATGAPILAIANGAFDVPGVRELFDTLPPRDVDGEGMEVKLASARGQRTFLLRTRKTFRPGNGSETTLVTLIDITDRNLAMDLARRQRLLLESMAEALIGMDTEWKVEQWNPAAERLFGYTAAEVRGRPVSDFIAVTNDVGAAREERRRAIAAGSTVRSEMRIKHRGGHWLDVQYSSMPILEHGVPVGYVSVLLDITARKRLEAELRERVEELTTANHELESFSYSVSHDLRAPVRAIDGFSELLEESAATTMDEESRRMLGLVRKNAKRMGLLIDDLLALARYSRQPLQEETVDLDALVRATSDEALRAEPKRKIASQIAALPSVHGDESLLRQVFLNLYSNAVKYTRGRTEALIETTVEETVDEVIVTVKDNGAGFDMRYAAKLFGTFERLHTVKEFEGTGIGLALVARIVKRHGGRVWGEGEVNKGATFHVALPKQAKTSKKVSP